MNKKLKTKSWTCVKCYGWDRGKKPGVKTEGSKKFMGGEGREAEAGFPRWWEPGEIGFVFNILQLYKKHKEV